MLMKHGKLTEWTKSSYSAVNGDCVEIKTAGHDAVAVRDSKDPRTGVLGFTANTWSAFLSDISRNPLH
ncbi:DUF397 domain-containing protein [Streptomyces sp. NBC_00683]|uniref:DUF397 domain-containing protein n=1 Tax=unclassified Streptomyces TaxID=2593676 RepID=UPI002E30FA41|nr:DUF397 domain-containing protein [Streptomyces sp. NBC_00683]